MGNKVWKEWNGVWGSTKMKIKEHSRALVHSGHQSSLLFKDGLSVDLQAVACKAFRAALGKQIPSFIVHHCVKAWSKSAIK